METVSDNTPPASDISFTDGVDLLQHLDSIDLTKIDRSFPVFKAGPCKVKLVGFETKKTKDQKGNLLVVKLTLAQAYPTEGQPGVPSKTIQPGFPVQDRISMTVKEKYNPAEKLADIQLCFTGKQAAGFKFADYVGKEGIIRFSIEESNEYGAQNRIRYVKAVPVPVANL